MYFSLQQLQYGTFWFLRIVSGTWGKWWQPTFSVKVYNFLTVVLIWNSFEFAMEDYHRIGSYSPAKHSLAVQWQVPLISLKCQRFGLPGPCKALWDGFKNASVESQCLASGNDMHLQSMNHNLYSKQNSRGILLDLSRIGNSTDSGFYTRLVFTYSEVRYCIDKWYDMKKLVMMGLSFHWRPHIRLFSFPDSSADPRSNVTIICIFIAYVHPILYHCRRGRATLWRFTACCYICASSTGSAASPGILQTWII